MSKWHENKWQDKADVVTTNTKEALQVIFDTLNKGQQKQVLKNDAVVELFRLYCVNTEVIE